MAQRVFCESHFLMIEAQPEKRSFLEHAVGEGSDRLAYEIALLGAEERPSVTFYKNESVSSVLPEYEDNTPVPVDMPMVTLDALTAGTEFARPQLIKLDVQGYELEVLAGATSLLRNRDLEAIVLEVSLIAINVGNPLFREVSEFLHRHNFRLYDIASLIRRPLDSALWQLDAIFVREWSQLVKSHRWA
jgi:FkbM family methyltransferase